MKCLVTGATGFIGRPLCQQLLRSGDDVLAFSKRGARLDETLVSQALDLATCDPDIDSLRDIDVLVHTAGVAHQEAATAAHQQLNHHATVRLARLAAAAGVKCFIFLSSVKAMGPPSVSGARTEADCSLPLEPYGLSKWQAECALRKEFAGGPMAIVILRPALVYGTAVKGNLQRLASAVARGLPRPPALGLRSMIALDDLVALLCCLAHNPPTGMHTWIASGSEAYSTQNIYDLLRNARGKGTGWSWLPPWAWRAAAWLLDTRSGWAGESTYEKLFATEVYCNEAVMSYTGWQPRVNLDSIIGDMSHSSRPVV